MPWDLQTAKQYLNIPAGDATKDQLVQRVMDIVLAYVENRLGRGLLYKREMISFKYMESRFIRLPRYPVAKIHSINGKPYTHGTKYLHQRTGVLELDGLHGYAGSREIIVDYEGGFNPMPDDMLQALWEILLDRWAYIDKTTGGPTVGAGATTIAGSGDVSSISLADFGTVRFDVGTTTVGGDSGQAGSAGQQNTWGWLAPWAWVLASYRSESAPTVAFA